MCDTTNFFSWLQMQDGQFLLSAYLLCANLADLTYIKYGFESRFWNVPLFGLFFVKGIH
jgi:methyl coenzyme M reductase alpha subunit